MNIIRMEDLKSGMCRWPYGDPQKKDFHFCGEQNNESGAYCEHHNKKSLSKK